MLTPHALAFLQGGRSIRQVRSDLQRRVQGEPAARLLPGLLHILVAPAPIPDPAAILAHRGGIALCGPPLSGRSLALLQIQARWAAAGMRSPALALALADDDAPNLSPRAVVAGAIHRAALPASYAEGGRPMILLLDGWEDLPSDRRALWRSYVTAAAAWPAARVVISLPPGEAWPGLTSLSLAAPDDDALASWLGRLLPSHDPAPILAALRREPLAALRASVGDLLLLAMAYPIIGLPASRAQLYEQAYALARPVLDEVDRHIAVGRAALRHYRLARGLAGGADLATLTLLPAPEVAAVAPLAAGLLDDPRPVLDLLWADGDPAPPAQRGLAACLRERPASATDAHLRLIELLLARGNHDYDAAIAPALPDMFAAAARGDQARAMRALGDLATRWPGDLAMSLLLLVIDRRDAAADLRWAAADLLASGPPTPADIAEAPAVADDLALAARAHIIALAAPALRGRLLDPALRPGLAALLGGAYGAQRQAAAAAALIDDVTAPSELRALALAGAPETAEGAALVQRALASPSQHLRRAALGALQPRPAAEALRLLSAALAEAAGDDAALHDLLEAAAQIPQPAVTGLLTRYALATQCGPELRVAALRLLADRPGTMPLLTRFLAADGVPELLRAAAARLLGAAHASASVPALRHILLGPGAPLLRRATAAALADLARAADGRAPALAALIEALAQPDIDAELTAFIAAALGAIGATQAIPALSTLLDPQRPAALRAIWLAAAPALGHTPAELWPTLALDHATRAVLLDSLAAGETAADAPSSLGELSATQAAQAAVAAAEALAAIAQLRPALAGDLCSRIRRAILAAQGAHAPGGLLHALARAAGDDLASELEALLDAPSGTPALRWAAIDLLGYAPQAADWLLERLRSGGDDTFTAGKLAEALGQLGDPRAVPVLSAIAAGPAVSPHLREAAIAALGTIGGDEPTAALLAIIRDSGAPAALRAAAVAALPQPIADETRRALHQIRRAEGLAPPLAATLLQRLARASDHEILPQLLRVAQSEQPLAAITMIDAIASLGDQSAAPVLVRISQSALAAPSVRLAAIAALLQLEGPAHLTLIRPYLESPLQPLRVTAHQIIAQIDPSDQRLSAALADVSAPLALRLSALERLSARSPDLGLLATILKRPDEPPQLRLRIVGALGHLGQAEAARALREALAAGGPPLLRRRCVAALGELAAADSETGSAARAIISDLANSAAALAEERHWAATILLDHTPQKDIQ